ncbi:MAG: phosphate/phosphite/phosphonate ABC transporter substrate-binding protein [Ignavibacteria bacterium]|jgi:phosphonate transport system substrate-binding protein
MKSLLIFVRITNIFFLIITIIFLSDCGKKEENHSEAANTNKLPQKGTIKETVISIGSVSHAIQNEILLLQPFADYLAENLDEFNIMKGRVVVTRDLEEMAKLINSAEVDIYIDSPFPTFSVIQMSNLRPILKHLRDDTEYYSSVLFTKADSEIDDLKDLNGKMVAMEESYSTSGYFLPMNLLISNGYSLSKFNNPNAKVPKNKVGYCFSEDDETTVFWVLNGKIEIGATDIISYYKNSADRVNELKIIAKSIDMPRQLVSIRSDLDTAYINEIKRTLLDMNKNESGKKALESFYSTSSFKGLPEKELDEIEKIFKNYFDSHKQQW